MQCPKLRFTKTMSILFVQKHFLLFVTNRTLRRPNCPRPVDPLLKAHQDTSGCALPSAKFRDLPFKELDSTG